MVVVNEISWSLVLNEMDHGFYSWTLVCGLCGSLLSVFVFFLFLVKILVMDLCILYLNCRIYIRF